MRLIMHGWQWRHNIHVHSRRCPPVTHQHLLGSRPWDHTDGSTALLLPSGRQGRHACCTGCADGILPECACRLLVRLEYDACCPHCGKNAFRVGQQWSYLCTYENFLRCKLVTQGCPGPPFPDWGPQWPQSCALTSGQGDVGLHVGRSQNSIRSLNYNPSYDPT
jgi:hypothetical protein